WCGGRGRRFWRPHGDDFLRADGLCCVERNHDGCVAQRRRRWRRMMRPLFLAIPVTIVIALTASNFEARAQGDAGAPAPVVPAAISADIIILHATNDNSGIDPKIGKMPELGKPPFSSYNSYKLLDHVKQPLTKGQSTTIKLPTG